MRISLCAYPYAHIIMGISLGAYLYAHILTSISLCAYSWLYKASKTDGVTHFYTDTDRGGDAAGFDIKDWQLRSMKWACIDSWYTLSVRLMSVFRNIDYKAIKPGYWLLSIEHLLTIDLCQRRADVRFILIVVNCWSVLIVIRSLQSIELLSLREY